MLHTSVHGVCPANYRIYVALHGVFNDWLKEIFVALLVSETYVLG